MNQPLPVAYKNRYPFALSCPSFIFPAGYSENVRRLGSCVDEIELLFFESRPDSLPSPVEIRELKTLSRDLDLTFNLHLPTDVSLAAAGRKEREQALEGMLRALDRARELAPTAMTLHLPGPERADDAKTLPAWQERVEQSAARLLDKSGLTAACFALENLDYPFDWLDDLLDRFDFSVCMDIGHLLFHQQDCGAFFRRYGRRITVIHAHGVVPGRDHLALDRLDSSQRRQLGSIISGFRGSLSLEVFNRQDLAASLDCLAGIWDNIGHETSARK
ncbi:MAG: cobamide remodeling phosphodiesterase CbiR [Desulfosudaceae bacterium]